MTEHDLDPRVNADPQLVEARDQGSRQRVQITDLLVSR